jgi:hypothetical protein
LGEDVRERGKGRGYLTFYHYDGWRLSDYQFSSANYFFAIDVTIWIHFLPLLLAWHANIAVHFRFVATKDNR